MLGKRGEEIDMKKEINILGRQVKIKKIIGLVVVVVFCYFVLISIRLPGTYSGEFVRADFLPRYDNGGSDAILYFKNQDDVYSYLIINEYSTGIMVELNSQVGKWITVHYGSSILGNTNCIHSYED